MPDEKSKSPRDARRQALTRRIAQYLLDTGLPGASLRPLAAACDTSDRMLLYYFEDKKDLLTGALFEVAQRLQVVLDAGITGQMPAPRLIPAIRSLLAGPELRPYMQLWLEVAARAARGEEPFRSVSHTLCAGYQAFIAAHLTGDAMQQAEQSAELLPVVEGWVLLDAIGYSSEGESGG